MAYSHVYLTYENTWSEQMIEEWPSYNIINYILTLVYLDNDPTLEGSNLKKS